MQINLPDNHVQTPSMDDFTQIKGIGQAVADRLHQAGILSFAALAENTPERLSILLADKIGFTPRRISLQDWIGQAGNLEKARQPSQEQGIQANHQDQQHYEVFTLELLIDKESKVRRTRSYHVQSEKEGVWAGWDTGKLSAFILERTGIRTDEALGVRIGERVETSQEEMPETGSLSYEAGEPQELTKKITGIFNIENLRLKINSGEVTGHTLGQGLPTIIEIVLDLSKLSTPSGCKLAYQADVYGQKRLHQERMHIGSSEGVLQIGEAKNILVTGKPLAPGDYVVETVVSVRLADLPERLENQLFAISEGRAIHVY